MVLGLPDKFVSTIPGLIHGLLAAGCLAFCPLILANIILVHKFDISGNIFVNDSPWFTPTVAFFTAATVFVLISITFLPIWTQLYTSTPAKRMGMSIQNIKDLHWARQFSFLNTCLFGLLLMHHELLLQSNDWLLVAPIVGVLSCAYVWLAAHGHKVGLPDGAACPILFDAAYLLLFGTQTVFNQQGGKRFYDWLVFTQVCWAWMYIWGYFLYYLGGRSVISPQGVRWGCRIVHTGTLVVMHIASVVSAFWVGPYYQWGMFVWRTLGFVSVLVMAKPRWK
eukprot:TRINITY_DN67542_c3_g1_i1.p1 TRINITY_DN67542_c3_g1~~TRINITY_DN67542_c3_g1_i1.p1  ORF type:complete len:280 (+),score=12.76 TRINITY_DN67542_c3_g1_i1:102-941(+)